MEELIKRSYQAIVNRGLITPKTTKWQFIKKIIEELFEVIKALLFEDKNRLSEELTDLLTVCLMFLIHLGYDPIKEFEKVVLKNEKRASNVTKK